MRKVRCYACHEMGHYASQCSNKKRNKKNAKSTTTAELDELMKKFNKEFSLMDFLGDISFLGFRGIIAWFLDSGASRHMMGRMSIFLSFSELDSGNFVGYRVSTRRVSFEGIWKCQIPTGFRRVSGVGQGTICSKVTDEHTLYFSV